MRSPAWLKVKPKLELDAIVTGGSADRIAWGESGEAVMLEFAYKHPRTGAREQRIGRPSELLGMCPLTWSLSRL